MAGFRKCPSCAGLPAYSDVTEGEPGKADSMKCPLPLCAELPVDSDGTVEEERVGQVVGWNTSCMWSHGVVLWISVLATCVLREEEGGKGESRAWTG